MDFQLSNLQLSAIASVSTFPHFDRSKFISIFFLKYDPANSILPYQTLVVLMSNQIKDNVRYLKPAADDKRDKDREEEMRERGEDPDAIQYRESDGS